MKTKLSIIMFFLFLFSNFCFSQEFIGVLNTSVSENVKGDVLKKLEPIPYFLQEAIIKISQDKKLKIEIVEREKLKEILHEDALRLAGFLKDKEGNQDYKEKTGATLFLFTNISQEGKTASLFGRIVTVAEGKTKAVESIPFNEGDDIKEICFSLTSKLMDTLFSSTLLDREKYLKNGKLELVREFYGEAEQNFLIVLEEDTENEEALFGLGISLQGQKRNDDAEKVYLKLVFFGKNKQFLKKAFNNLGVIYKTREDYDKAIEVYKKAVSLDEKFVEPYYGLGVIYELKEEKDKAKEHYKKCLIINPEYEGCKLRLEALK